MSYFPYFRGKQYELICIRENAELIMQAGFTPIIEPVKEQFSSLEKALKSLKDANANFLIIANPSVGEHAEFLKEDVLRVVTESISDYGQGGWLYKIQSENEIEQFNKWTVKHNGTSIFHDGFSSGKILSEFLDSNGLRPNYNIFPSKTPKTYFRHFKGTNRILIADGFTKCSNKDYPCSESFSELNITYEDEGANGFGDYLIVGSDYSEGGGPAYAVAIHITYKDPDNDNAIYVNHYISETVDTPLDPAGKFREALNKLYLDVEKKQSKLLRTNAIEEFMKLHHAGHFPGLGYVKKLSMQHHLELMASK